MVWYLEILFILSTDSYSLIFDLNIEFRAFQSLVVFCTSNPTNFSEIDEKDDRKISQMGVFGWRPRFLEVSIQVISLFKLISLFNQWQLLLVENSSVCCSRNAGSQSMDASCLTWQ